MDAIQAAWLLRALEVTDKVIEDRRTTMARYGAHRATYDSGTGAHWNGYLIVRSGRALPSRSPRSS